MNNSFDRLITRLDIAEDGIFELDGISMKIPKLKSKERKTEKNKILSKN